MTKFCWQQSAMRQFCLPQSQTVWQCCEGVCECCTCASGIPTGFGPRCIKLGTVNDMPDARGNSDDTIVFEGAAPPLMLQEHQPTPLCGFINKMDGKWVLRCSFFPLAQVLGQQPGQCMTQRQSRMQGSLSYILDRFMRPQCVIPVRLQVRLWHRAHKNKIKMRRGSTKIGASTKKSMHDPQKNKTQNSEWHAWPTVF